MHLDRKYWIMLGSSNEMLCVGQMEFWERLLIPRGCPVWKNRNHAAANHRQFDVL
jgi:hypothetical protein